jgi:SulP family sulfate permease
MIAGVPKPEEITSLITFEHSPRANHLRNAVKVVMDRTEAASASKIQHQQPLPLLLQSLQPFAPDLNEDFFFRLVPYFKRVHVQRGTSLWTTEAIADSFFLIESGMLRANYRYLGNSHSLNESMVAGTVAGGMSFAFMPIRRY